MSDITTQSGSLDARRRRARFRAWHRGTREADLILGTFAEREIAGLSDAELDLFEALLNEADGDILKWTTGEAELPERCDNPLVRRIVMQRRFAAG